MSAESEMIDKMNTMIHNLEEEIQSLNEDLIERDAYIQSLLVLIGLDKGSLEIGINEDGPFVREAEKVFNNEY